MYKFEKEINCNCGKIHQTSVKRIIIEENILSNIPDYLKDIYPIGHICLVSNRDIAAYIDVRHSLRKAGYKITEIIYDSFTKFNKETLLKFNDLDDSIRFIIGIGSGTINDIVKHISYIRKIPNAMIITAPSTDSYINSIAYPYDTYNLSEIKCTPPILIVIDTKIKIPRALIAAGLSTLYLRMLGIFDYQYEKNVFGIYYCKYQINEIKDYIRNFFNENFDYNNLIDIKRLYKTLINISLKMSYLYPEKLTGATDVLLRLIRKRKYNCPVAPLLAAHSINLIYNFYLHNNKKNILLPSDRAVIYEKFNKIYKIDNFQMLLNLKGLSEKTYSKIAYSTENMRNELKNELNYYLSDSKDIVKMIKNVFIDKGYHISDIIDYNDLLMLIQLSSELSINYSLINYIDNDGILAALIEQQSIAY